jgi:transposase
MFKISCVKRSEDVVEILEAYDLLGSYRAAAAAVGCDHHTVRRYVRLRAAGNPPGERAKRCKPIDVYLPKIEELVERSNGKVRADVVHERLAAMGFEGGERTTRRAVAAAKDSYRAGHRRVFRPWVPEPGLWLQWDYGHGPVIRGRQTTLWCAWLAWSRFRVVLPVFDKTLPTVIGCLDATLRRLGGVPTYALTDNEKTVTTEHIARIAVRHPEIVEVGRHYGLTIRTCVPADPQSKGGSEATVRIAKADLVPTAANLLEEYRTFGDLERACREFCDGVNMRVHRETRRAPIEALAEEQQRLHPLPGRAYTSVFGQTRRVNWDSTVQLDAVRYSVPHHLIDTRVWVRQHGEEIIVTTVGAHGPEEVARHPAGRPGHPQIRDEHYPARTDPADRQPKPVCAEEAAFLAIGDGATQWLLEAAACGTKRIRSKMADAVTLAKLHGTVAVDRALGTAAVAGRFLDNDLKLIIDHQQRTAGDIPQQRSEQHSLQPGTSVWARFGHGTGEAQ